MSEIIDVTANGDPIYYDANGNAMIQQNGQWVYAPAYNRHPVQTQPAPQLAPVVQRAPAPAPAPAAQSNSVGLLAQFQSGAVAMPTFMSEGSSSMDGQESTMVDSIRVNKRGDLYLVMGGVSLPPQRYLDVVILGVGPSGGGQAVYRTLYADAYNEDDTDRQPPVCFSYDNVTPAPNAPAPQCATCKACPMNVKGSGPNNTRRCGRSMNLMVALATDLTQVYRFKVSTKGIYAEDAAKNEYGLKPYATLLKKMGANWEGVVTRLEFIGGFSEGVRFTPIRFLEQSEYQQAQELKMKVQIELFVNLNEDQSTATVTMSGQTVGQIPVANIGNVVQQVQQAAHTAAMTAVANPSAQPAQVAHATNQAPVQHVVAQPTPAAQHAVQQPAAPVVQPAPQPAPAPAPKPASFKDTLQAHPAWASLPAEVTAWVLNPAVDDKSAHDYLAANYPQVLAPVQPVPTSTPPQPTVQAAPAATTVQTGVATGQQVVQGQAGAPVATAAVAGAPTTHNAAPMMPAQPAEPVMTTGHAPSPQPAQQPGVPVTTVNVANAESIDAILNSI